MQILNYSELNFKGDNMTKLVNAYVRTNSELTKKYIIYKEMVEMELLNYFCELMEEER